MTAQKKKKRRYRYFTEKEIARILKEYDKAPHGKKGKVLRKHKLRASHIAFWRKHAA